MKKQVFISLHLIPCDGSYVVSIILVFWGHRECVAMTPVLSFSSFAFKTWTCLPSCLSSQLLNVGINHHSILGSLLFSCHIFFLLVLFSGFFFPQTSVTHNHWWTLHLFLQVDSPLSFLCPLFPCLPRVCPHAIQPMEDFIFLQSLFLLSSSSSSQALKRET